MVTAELSMAAMSPKERIEAVLSASGLSKTALAYILGYDRPQVIYDVYNERTKVISKELARRLTDAIPELSFNWLRTGMGDMWVAPFMGVRPFPEAKGKVGGRGFHAAKMEKASNLTQGDFGLFAETLDRLTRELSEALRREEKLIDIIAKFHTSQ